MTNSARPDGPAVDPRHLLVIGAGPGLDGAIAHRFAQGGYHLTLWPGARTGWPNWPAT
jgi:hypothetical protein